MFNPLMPSRKRPARTPGLAGTNTAFLVPDNVRKKFMDGGWSSHVPLTYLTDKGCLFKDRSSTVLAQDLLTVDPTSGAIQTTSTSLSEEGELDLTFDEWHQAWRRLVFKSSVRVTGKWPEPDRDVTDYDRTAGRGFAIPG